MASNRQRHVHQHPKRDLGPCLGHVNSWCNLGSVLALRKDWGGAETAFSAARTQSRRIQMTPERDALLTVRTSLASEQAG